MKRYEWEALAQLLKQGYPFREAYEMLQGDQRLFYAMEKGYPLSKCLVQGHHEPFYEHLRFFLDITALPNAILSALAIDDITRKIQSKLLKEISYPLFLFLMSFCTLMVFTTFILPQLIQSFDMSSSSFLLMAVAILKLFSYIVLWGMIIVLIIGLLMKRSLSIKLFVLNAIRFSALPQQYCSYLLAAYYTQFIRHGISTKNAMAFLAQLKTTSLLSICAQQIEDKLLKGMSLDECLKEQKWLDKSFIKHWHIGSHTQNMEAAMIQYQDFQSEQWKRLLKRTGKSIQVFSYGFVAGMVILVYQIMLVPLQLLETM